MLGGDDGRINIDVLVQRDLGDRGVVLRVCNTSVVLETEMTHTMAPAVVVARKCAETTWTMARLCEGRGASASGDIDYMLYRAVSRCSAWLIVGTASQCGTSGHGSRRISVLYTVQVPRRLIANETRALRINHKFSSCIVSKL